MKKIAFVIAAPFLVFFGVVYVVSALALLLIARISSRETAAKFLLDMSDSFYDAYLELTDKDDEKA